MRQDISPVLLFTVGGIVTVLMVWAGLVLIGKDKKTN
jgi:hypothetical protein